MRYIEASECGRFENMQFNFKHPGFENQFHSQLTVNSCLELIAAIRCVSSMTDHASTLGLHTN